MSDWKINSIYIGACLVVISLLVWAGCFDRRPETSQAEINQITYEPGIWHLADSSDPASDYIHIVPDPPYGADLYRVGGSLVWYNPNKFNPETHYVVRIDTVGRVLDSNLYLTDIRYETSTGERMEIKHSQPIDWKSWGGVDSVISRSRPCKIEWEYVVRPILDSTIAKKKPFLGTPEELEKLREMIE